MDNTSKYSREARDKGLTYLGASDKGRTFGEYLLPCGHQEALRVSNVRKPECSYPKCKACRDEAYERRLAKAAKSQGLTPMPIYRLDLKDRREREFLLPCGHFQSVKLRHVLVKSAPQKCKFCKSTATRLAKEARAAKRRVNG